MGAETLDAPPAPLPAFASATMAPMSPPPCAPLGARAARIGRLAAEMATAYAEGDVDAARALHELLGRMLAAPATVQATGAAADENVVSLEEARRRRDGR